MRRHPGDFYADAGPALAVLPPPEIVLVEDTLIAELQRSAASAWPAEICGVLGGRRRPGRWRLTSGAPLRNLAGPHRFAADPVEFARVEARLRAAGTSFCGFYHSHPDASALPSEADSKAAWRSALMLIVPVSGAEPRRPAVWWPTGNGARPVGWRSVTT